MTCKDGGKALLQIQDNGHGIRVGGQTGRGKGRSMDSASRRLGMSQACAEVPHPLPRQHVSTVRQQTDPPTSNWSFPATNTPMPAARWLAARGLGHPGGAAHHLQAAGV